MPVDVIINWLWQGCLVVAALALMLRLLDAARAQLRYALCWATLGLVLALPAASGRGAAVAEAAQAPAPYAPVMAMPEDWWTSSLLASVAWGLWVAFHGFRLVRAMYALERVKRRSRAFPAELERGLQHWMRLRASGRRVALAISDRVSAAGVLGGRSPLIAVSPAVAATLSADELDAVIVHEWAHVQRRDDVTNGLQLVVRLVAGWHPAVWWIDRRLQVEREMACDEAVVAMTATPKAYAASLLKLAALPRAANAAVPAIVGRGGLARRIVRIVSTRPLPTAWRVRSAAAAAFAMLGAGSLVIASVRLVAIEVFVPRAPSPPLFDAPAPAASVAAVRVTMPVERTTSAVALPRRVSASVGVASAASVAAPADERPAAPAALDAFGSGVHEGPPPLVSSPIGMAASLVSTPAPAPFAEGSARSAWSAAADAGVAIGRGSRNAGVATAGFFTRLATQVASSF